MEAKNIDAKINPTLRVFKKLAQDNNLIVFSYKFFSDWLTPLSIYCALKKTIKSESFLLESIEGEEKICRFSFLGFMPLCTFRHKGKVIYLKQKKLQKFKTTQDPLFELKQVMDRFRVEPKQNRRFFGGFVGYLGYDTVRFYEPLGEERPDSLRTYDSYFMLPRILIIFDHLKHQVEILDFAFLKNKKNLAGIYRREKRFVGSVYRKITSPYKLPDLNFSASKLKIHSNFQKKDFIAAVKRAKQYIKEGEIIQAVLSQRFSVKFKKDPLTVYRYLRILNPSPYMFYLDFGRLKIAGASPEMLLRCEGRELVTRPIAGTRKRGRTEKEDASLRKSLLADPKEKAEHLMLVDLARNDLGRVSDASSINLPIFMKVEKFSHVMHIVSEVRGKLAQKQNIFSSLISCFPAGTVSGAPKVRAMQIINELEPQRRGIYAGSVGYFSFTKSLDTCIIIRTILFKGDRAYIQAGAGIVADSKPENEHREIINKARAQILALELAR